MSELQRVTEVEGITEYRSENGVRVLLFPDESKDVVTVNMTVFVGSRHEGYGEAGIAHLVEHMLFKGTETHPEIPKTLQERGARFNGTTWFDRTNYYQTLPATTENLRFALELESDRLVNSLISEEDLASEMTVVRSEFERGENSPHRVLVQRMQAAAYDWHNYGQATIGNQSDIERVPVSKLRAFYRKYYRPDNILLVVAGKFDVHEAVEMIRDTFGKLARPDTEIDKTYTLEPPKDGERTVTLRRVGDVQLVGSLYHVPAASHPEFAAIRALAIVLGDEPSGRLYKSLVETEQASRISTMSFALAEPGTLMAIAEVPRSRSLEQARSTLDDTLERSLVDNPITEREVARARSLLLKQRELQASNTDQLAVALSDWAAQGDWRLYFLFRDCVEALSVQQVQAAAETYLVRNNRTTGLFIPSETAERVSIPKSDDTLARLEGYRGREVTDVGETFDPTPSNVEARTMRGEFSPGLQYALLPKRSRGASVSMLFALRFGNPETLAGRRGAAELLGTLMARGTESMDFQMLRDELIRLRTDLSVSSTAGLLQLSVKTKRESLNETLGLIKNVLRTPRLGQKELDSVKLELITSLKQGLSEPSVLAVRAAQRALSPYPSDDLRYVQTVGEEIEMYERVEVEELRSLYHELLCGQKGEFAAVGDFDAEYLKSSLPSMFGEWRSGVEYRRVERPAAPVGDGNLIEIHVADKANAFFYAASQMQLKDTTPEFACLVLGNYVLGGGALSSRLGIRVRQREGLSYNVRSSLSPRPKDSRLDWTVYAIANPENKDRLIRAIREEVEMICREGVTEEELETAKSALLQSERIRRTNDNALASELLQTMFLERSMSFAADFEERVQTASVEAVSRALRDHLDWQHLEKAIAGDFATED